MGIIRTTFIASASGPWRIERIDPVAGWHFAECELDIGLVRGEQSGRGVAP
ncbi:hypothetical protein J2S30_002048 [Herbaspirillum rubrisubalbicans]|uniref:hypothetical protein n=1 Tax=Herbaspirillum rubrisubalbicans TaxID=80842 RepID=UPI00209D8107|nr:hypothetical protein [Herbaspirillum rubrisubalbicans]MCP1573669.1 hypothetical protein [Herbaspirillum rubrisubalbicans]